ncbi:Di-copper centre-containing protein [Hypoxylon sp. NC1633]|nr:Di-copper centre-containing protein [Hypoxylon sp. NC1633]
MTLVGLLIAWAAYVPFAVLASLTSSGDQAQKPLPVMGMTTGINNRTGEHPVRWEINALHDEGGPRWDLYIQGLAALQNKTETDQQSHFSLSGIHGMPYAPFNGVGPVPGGSGGGFCPHGETQFVAWHRLYVVLYEQVLGAEVQRIASEYGNHQNASAYSQAAQAFRIPYWDWAANPQLPPSCTQQNVTVDGPRGPLTLRNPLYSYRWQTYPLNQTQFPGSQGWPAETTRASGGHGDFSPDAVNADLAEVADELKDLVYQTFTTAETFDQMSSMLDPVGVSLEAPHDIVHNAVGGSFASLDITAFDSLLRQPLVIQNAISLTYDQPRHSMLHHANIDRLAALWMAVHFNATHQSESYTTSGLYATARGAKITAASPLKPFYQRDGRSFHTSLTAASLEPFGYTYPELARWEGKKKEEGGGDADLERRGRAVMARVDELYGSGRGTRDRNGTGLPGQGNEGAGEEQKHWSVHVTVDRSTVDLPCTIDIYVGDVLGGRVTLLGMPKLGHAHAEIPLQRAIGNVSSNHSAVETALRGQLRVDVRTAHGDGSPVNASASDDLIAGLQVQLVARPVMPRRSRFEFPTPAFENRSLYTDVVSRSNA